MQPEIPNTDDLEYLSRLGYEKVPVNDSDLADLKRKVRSERPALSRVYVMLGSLLLGIAMGAALFFGLNKSPLTTENADVRTSSARTEAPVPEQGTQLIQLDTIDVVKENFINPSALITRPSGGSVPVAPLADSADVIVSKPLDLSLLAKTEVKEEKLKYMINSPVFYLHDMKITNYTTLYFKKNHFVKFTGLSAVYSATSEVAPAGSSLKQSADYYLHEEIANAMLSFKKGKYDRTINSLKTISSYNENDLNCDFYLAMCYYYKKNYTKAAELFDLCITHSNNTFLQEAMFYKALALYEGDHKEEATLLFRKIAEENEFYAEKAKSYVKN